MGLDADGWNVVVASVSAVAAFGSLGTAMAALKASRSSSSAAEKLTQIERQRLHIDLTPILDVKCHVDRHGAGRLWLRLDGPIGLDRLDSVEVIVRDDKRRELGPTYTDEQRAEAAAQIWGPLKFRPRIDGADETGRRVRPFDMLKAESRLLAMDMTGPPSWVTDTPAWVEGYLEAPLLIEIHCRREGYEPWVIVREVPVHRSPTSAESELDDLYDEFLEGEDHPLA